MKAFLAFLRSLGQLVVIGCQIVGTVFHIVWLSISNAQNRRWWREQWRAHVKATVRRHAMMGINLHALTWRQALGLLAFKIWWRVKSIFTNGRRKP